MAVTDFVTFTVTITNTGLQLPGFGTPLIPSYAATFLGSRTYGQLSDVAVDFPAGTVEWTFAKAIFSQAPHAQQIKIAPTTGTAPTMRYSVGAAAAVNSTKYQIQVDGPGITSTLVSITSGGSATLQAINSALLAALNAVVGANYTAAFAPLAFTDFTFTADSTTEQALATAHGLNTGDGPIQVSNSGGALPTGLSAATNYWVIKVDANHLKFATNLSNALAGTAIDLTTNGTGTQTLNHQTGTLSPILPLVVAGTAPGNWFSLEIRDSALLSCAMTSVDPGVSATLDGIRRIDDDWYWLVNPWASRTIILATASWAEANGKAYLASTVDTDAINLAVTGGDVLDTLAGFGYTYVGAKYHPSPVQAFDAASEGRVAPLEPGRWTEFGKTLVGVQPVTLTPTQRLNLRNKRAGSYTKELGRSITWDGKVGSTVFGYLDIRVGIDWFVSRVQGAAFGTMVSLDKVSYTDEDIEAIATAVRGVIAEAVSDAHRLLDPGDPTDPTNPPPTVVFPRVADIDPSVRALRNLPNGLITGRFQGAVQSIAFRAVLAF